MRSAGLRESSAHWEGQMVDADVVSFLAIHGLKRFGLTPKAPPRPPVTTDFLTTCRRSALWRLSAQDGGTPKATSADAHFTREPAR
jgi:hypothetical protein